MVLQCLHYDINNATYHCSGESSGSYEQCAQRVDCSRQQDEHCFGVFNETTVIRAGCNPQFPKDSEKCDSECIGKPRGKVHYCCCTKNNCNEKLIMPPTPPPPPPPPPLPPPPLSPTFQPPWLLILVILMLITVIIGSFVKRKSIKRATRGLMNHVEAGGPDTIQGRNHNNHHTGSKSNTKNHNTDSNHHHHHQTNNIGNSNISNARELNEMRIVRDVSIIIPFQVTTKNTDINSSSTSQPQQGDARGDTSSAPVQQYYTRIDLKDIKLLEIVGSGRFGRVHKACIERTSSDNDNNNNASNTTATPITTTTSTATNDTKEAGDNDNHGKSNHHDQDKLTNGEANLRINFSEIAVKIIHASEHQSWQNELKIYSFPKTRHQNILGFLGSCQHVESDSYWLLVEYAPRGSLHHYLKDNTVSWNELLNISLGIVRGLSHLHDADVAHRDFKSKNVLLKQDLTPCITDFGVASMLENSSGSQTEQRKKYLQVGTPRYMAPEVLECSVTFTKTSFTKIDVYALSLTLWELMYRCWPLPKLLHYDGDDSLIMNGNYVQMPPPPPPPPPPPQDDNLTDEQTNLLADGNTDQAPPDYMMPFENVVGSNPDINTMRQVVICEKHRPPIKHEWYYFPVSKFCQAIIDGWEYDHDARISASCFVERIEGLQQQQLQEQYQFQQHHQQQLPSPPPPPPPTIHSSSPVPAPVPEQFQSQESQSQCPS